MHKFEFYTEGHGIEEKLKSYLLENDDYISVSGKCIRCKKEVSYPITFLFESVFITIAFSYETKKPYKFLCPRCWLWREFGTSVKPNYQLTDFL